MRESEDDEGSGKRGIKVAAGAALDEENDFGRNDGSIT